jgi:dCTP diphosphatase
MNDGSEKEEEATTALPYDLATTRSLLFDLTGTVGDLSKTFRLKEPPQVETSAPIMNSLLSILVEISNSLHIHLPTAMTQKVALNRRKYPVELCQGKAGKYTEYSKATGITKESQSTASLETTVHTSMEQWREDLRKFCVEREWSRFHLPRNLLLALIGEVGELVELLQWKGDDNEGSTLKADELEKLSQELSDVTIYLIRLADVCGVELEDGIL